MPNDSLYPEHTYEHRPGIVRTALAGTGTPRRFARNRSGRDFVVGDLHGAFATLESLLEDVSFDDERDRLFSVGDLVDRGARSDAALEWVENFAWFHAIRGNHEQLLLDSHIDKDAMNTWMGNGGEWWRDEEEERRERFREAFARLPFAMEIETATGTVGIVHADVPRGQTWDALCDDLEAGDRTAVFHAIWHRGRCFETERTDLVAGRVDRVYCGHTPMDAPTVSGNVHYVDTGAGRHEKLTIAEIHPEPHRTRTRPVTD